jgi:pimeloyl-ACP methyl ester carboxylesterase
MKTNDAAVSVFKTKQGESEYRKAYNNTLTLWPVPFEENDVPTRFGSTHVIASGEKSSPPLVLLHGAQASSTMWFPNIEALSRAHRVYAIDFILEVSKSSLDTRMSTRLDLTNWLVDVFDHYSLEMPSLVGMSRGAWNAVVFALQCPARVNKLVLLSPAQTFTPIRNLRFLAATLMCVLFPSDRRADKMTRIVSFKKELVAPLYVEQYKRALSSFNALSGIQVPPALFTDQELGSLSMPVLLLIGDHDVINDVSSIKRAQRTVPNIDADMVTDAGHLLTMDRADYVNDRVVKFLSK